MIVSLEGNIVVVRALLEQGGENDNFGLFLMLICQFQHVIFCNTALPNATALRGSAHGTNRLFLIMTN
jgi:hypothetical protein